MQGDGRRCGSHGERIDFISALSMRTTRHVREMLLNPRVAGAVHLETEEVARIRGVQFTGLVSEAEPNDPLLRSYHEKFPVARSMDSSAWLLAVDSFKMTDNTVSFGHKIVWGVS